MRFVLVDASAGAKTTDGSIMTPDALATIAAGLTVYANRDVAAEYGGDHAVRAASGPTDVLPGEIACIITPALTVAGAIAYHSDDGSGDPDVFDGLTLSDSIMGAGNSVSVALSHEVAETIGDPGCNLAAVDMDGTAKAREACDPVEQQSYPIQLGSVSVYASNFVLQSYFTPSHAGPFDYMTQHGLAGAVAPPAPMQPAPAAGGNYQIVYSSVGSESQVTALGDAKGRRAGKAIGARAARRGLK